MGVELPTRSFRSGNSVAIRIPAAFGVEPGGDWIVIEQGQDLVLRRKPAEKKYIDVSGFAGKAPGIKLAPREDFEERPSTIAARLAAEQAGKDAA